MNFSQMALRSAGSPEEGVYLVKPRESASSAAAIMYSGVLKSGSPAPKLMTFSPAAFIAFALALTDSVREGVIVPMRFASLSMKTSV